MAKRVDVGPDEVRSHLALAQKALVVAERALLRGEGIGLIAIDEAEQPSVAVHDLSGKGQEKLEIFFRLVEDVQVFADFFFQQVFRRPGMTVMVQGGSLAHAGFQVLPEPLAQGRIERRKFFVEGLGKEFFPAAYNRMDTLDFDKVRNSICVHLFCSMNDIESIYTRVFSSYF